MLQEIEVRAEMIYSCQECRALFLFIEDVTGHSKMFGHDRIDELPLG
jgi:hypothetical protein